MYTAGMDQATGSEYGLNVSKWIKDHPEHRLQRGFEGLGFTATRRNEQGEIIGKPVTAMTLDELAALVETHGA